LYWPAASVFALRLSPLTGFSMVTVASGITAPEPSVTVPVMVPAAVWACRFTAGDSSRNGKRAKTKRLGNECIYRPPGDVYGLLAENCFKKKQSQPAGVWCRAKSLRIGGQMQVADRRLAPSSVSLPGAPSPARREKSLHARSHKERIRRVTRLPCCERARSESSRRTPAREHSKEPGPTAKGAVRALWLAYGASL
jgi:hypothetical protein